MKIVKSASGNKISISKREWTDIGKRAGWMKVSRTWEDGLKVSQRASIEYGGASYNPPVMNAVIQFLSESDQEYEVSVAFKFEWETPQDGGTTDPSWEGHYWLSDWKITKIDPITQDRNNIEYNINSYIEYMKDDIANHYTSTIISDYGE